MLWRRKSPVIWLIVSQLVQADNKCINNILLHLHLVSKIHRWPSGIPRKGPIMRKSFPCHLFHHLSGTCIFIGPNNTTFIGEAFLIYFLHVAVIQLHVSCRIWGGIRLNTCTRDTMACNILDIGVCPVMQNAEALCSVIYLTMVDLIVLFNQLDIQRTLILIGRSSLDILIGNWLTMVNLAGDKMKFSWTYRINDSHDCTKYAAEMYVLVLNWLEYV